jgi:hypothetical protein
MLIRSDILPLPAPGNFVCTECDGRTVDAAGAIRALDSHHTVFPADALTARIIADRLDKRGNASRASMFRKWAAERFEGGVVMAPVVAPTIIDPAVINMAQAELAAGLQGKPDSAGGAGGAGATAPTDEELAAKAAHEYMVAILLETTKEINDAGDDMTTLGELAERVGVKVKSDSADGLRNAIVKAVTKSLYKNSSATQVSAAMKAASATLKATTPEA